jgi:hypothetical protein
MPDVVIDLLRLCGGLRVLPGLSLHFLWDPRQRRYLGRGQGNLRGRGRGLGLDPHRGGRRGHDDLYRTDTNKCN